MDELFIEVEISTKNKTTEIYTSVPSFIALYVYRFLKSPSNIKLSFVRTFLPEGSGKLKLRTEKLRRELTENDILCKQAAGIQAIRDLRLPIYAKDGNTFIAGMCAVCRELISQQDSVEYHKLLGFKNSCLLAPAETSVWTRFCEVNIVDAIDKMLYKQSVGEQVNEMPVEVTRFEKHMNEPVRMHNIYKLAREQARKEGNVKIIIDCTTPKEQLPIEHIFAEGVAFTIADLILYPCFRLIFNQYPSMLIHFPLTSTWISEVDSFESMCKYILMELHPFTKPTIESLRSSPLTIADCTAVSLYKSDPKRYKPRNRIYTEQQEVEASLSKLESLCIEFSSNSNTAYNGNSIDWNTIEPEHAMTSALPQSRLQRKRQQLENVGNAVVSLARSGECIVDFCSGTGHLGILLASQLPECTVILMENKAISLERAKKRAVDLNLTNCRFYQCNIDYFEGSFDVGTSLHACGTATDVVLQQCLRARAKFVCCPCCYGSLQPMPHISYPLSKSFRSVLNEKDFLHIAHTADQAHALGTLNCRPETSLQGQLCMDIVDSDRKLQAEEAGYEVILTRLKPEQCTPKNRLLVGRIST